MGSQLKSFLYCTDNSKCVHYGNYSSCIQENWLEKGKDDHQPFCLFGKPSECRYHSLRGDRGKHSLGSEMRRKYNKFLCEYVDFWVLQETKNRKKKKKTMGDMYLRSRHINLGLYLKGMDELALGRCIDLSLGEESLGQNLEEH